MNNKKIKQEDDKDFLRTIVFLAFAFVLIIGLVLFSSRVKFSAECEVTGINFELNETNDLTNFSMINGNMNCKFTGDVPMGVILRGLK